MIGNVPEDFLLRQLARRSCGVQNRYRITADEVEFVRLEDIRAGGAVEGRELEEDVGALAVDGGGDFLPSGDLGGGVDAGDVGVAGGAGEMTVASVVRRVPGTETRWA